jgi:glucokinase
VKSQFVGLVGDVGGTNARFALVDDEGHIRHPHTYAAKDFATLDAVIASYLKTVLGGRHPSSAVIAVAGPVIDGEIEFTNIDWRISEGDMIAAFEFEAVRLLNDFAAQALAAPRLAADHLKPLGPRMRGAAQAPIVVLGAGTGFGVGALTRSDRGEVGIATEGGHAGFAPFDDLEVEVWRRIKARHGRVSIERLLSGPGMYDLYRALGEIRGAPAEFADEKAVFEAADLDPLAGETLDRFCALLGGAAGDLALTFGARGGVYVSGGIAPRMAERLAAGGFRERFEAKGRLSDYMREIPTWLVVHPYAAIVGAARELEQMRRALI